MNFYKTILLTGLTYITQTTAAPKNNQSTPFENQEQLMFCLDKVKLARLGVVLTEEENFHLQEFGPRLQEIRKQRGLIPEKMTIDDYLLTCYFKRREAMEKSSQQTSKRKAKKTHKLQKEQDEYSSSEETLVKRYTGEEFLQNSKNAEVVNDILKTAKNVYNEEDSLDYKKGVLAWTQNALRAVLNKREENAKLHQECDELAPTEPVTPIERDNAQQASDEYKNFDFEDVNRRLHSTSYSQRHSLLNVKSEDENLSEVQLPSAYSIGNFAEVLEQERNEEQSQNMITMFFTKDSFFQMSVKDQDIVSMFLRFYGIVLLDFNNKFIKEKVLYPEITPKLRKRFYECLNVQLVNYAKRVLKHEAIAKVNALEVEKNEENDINLLYDEFCKNNYSRCIFLLVNLLQEKNQQMEFSNEQIGSVTNDDKMIFLHLNTLEKENWENKELCYWYEFSHKALKLIAQLSYLEFFADQKSKRFVAKLYKGVNAEVLTEEELINAILFLENDEIKEEKKKSFLCNYESTQSIGKGKFVLKESAIEFSANEKKGSFESILVKIDGEVLFYYNLVEHGEFGKFALAQKAKNNCMFYKNDSQIGHAKREIAKIIEKIFVEIWVCADCKDAGCLKKERQNFLNTLDKNIAWCIFSFAYMFDQKKNADLAGTAEYIKIKRKVVDCQKKMFSIFLSMQAFKEESAIRALALK